MKKKDLAAQAGISVFSLTKMARGANMTTDVLVKVCRALNCTMDEIMEILKGLHKEGRTVILITHDNDIAAQAKRVIKIMDGRIVEDYLNDVKEVV